jgi:hypothetical protein
MKNRPKKQPTKWRIIWFQLVDGVRRMKWHTGSLYECQVLERCCIAAKEEYNLCAPGTFKG